MADPLSIAASLTSLIALGGQISAIIYEFVSNVADAPKSARAALRSIEQMRLVLASLQQMFENGLSRFPENRKKMVHVSRLIIVLRQSILSCSELEAVVNFATSTVRNGSSLSRIRWGLKEDKINSCIQRLESDKTSLSAMLHILHCESEVEAQECLRTLQENIELVSQQNQAILQRFEQSNLHFETEAASVRFLEDDESVRATTIIHRDSASSAHEPDSSIFEEAVPLQAGISNEVAAQDFEYTLEQTRVYRRVRLDQCDISFTSSAVLTHAWSTLSDLSQSDVSAISVFALPVSLEDISNIGPDLTFTHHISYAAAQDLQRTDLVALQLQREASIHKHETNERASPNGAAPSRPPRPSQSPFSLGPRYFKCVSCGQSRANPEHQDPGRGNHCIYCFAKETDIFLLKERKWCIAGGHSTSRTDFLDRDGIELHDMCIRHQAMPRYSQEVAGPTSFVPFPVDWFHQTTSSKFREGMTAGIKHDIFPVFKNDKMRICEPEASFFFAARDLRVSGADLDMKADECFVLFHAGKNAIDVVGLQVEKVKPYFELALATRPTSGKCDTNSIDMAFKNWLRELLGQENYSKLAPSNARGLITTRTIETGPIRELMRQFTERKEDFLNSSQDFKLRLPAPLDRISTEKRVDEGKFIIYRGEMKHFIQPCINGLIQLIADKISAVAEQKGRQVKNIVIVGEFGAIPYIQDELREALGMKRINLYRPSHDGLWTAILNRALTYDTESQ